jgi:phosphoadenosine phosphosulfate reductase
MSKKNTNKKSIAEINKELRNKTPYEIIEWAVEYAKQNKTEEKSGAIVSTNFRPFEAAILHVATKIDAAISVLWVDHGYNRPATYRHAEKLKKLLGLNIKAYVPKVTTAHRDAIDGPIPTPEHEAELKKFSAIFKLEPFQRGIRELAPVVWITALRKVQNPNRAELDIISEDKNFGALKVNPFFYWSNEEIENYLKENNLPNEWDYFDPAKADEKRECGLHTTWGADAVTKV